jgi:hypothetical protein
MRGPPMIQRSVAVHSAGLSPDWLGPEASGLHEVDPDDQGEIEAP